MTVIDPDNLSETRRALLEQRLRNGQRVDNGVVPVHRSGPQPLSVTQEQLWYFSRLSPDSPVYNEVATICKTGPLDVAALRAALSEVVRRHEIWRSSFPNTSDGPVQVVHQATAIDVPLVDFSHLSAGEAERQAVQVIAAKARPAYDVEHGPLLRPTLIRFSPGDHRLYLAMHHLIFDGVTVSRTILSELIALYGAFVKGMPLLPDPPLQYADYTHWERGWLASSRVARRVAWWRQHLAGAPPLNLLLDRQRPPMQRFAGSMEPVTISATLADKLRAFSRETGSTLFQTIASSFGLLLHRYSGQDDIVFGTASDLRQRPELESLVGYCLTPLVLRCDFSGDPSFRELVQRMGRELIDGLDHAVPFQWLVRELQPVRDARTNPYFQSMLVLEPQIASPDPEWSVHYMDTALGSSVGNAKFDFELEFDERTDGHLVGRLTYNVDIFDAATIRRMIDHWGRLLEGALSDPSRPVGELQLLSPQEWQQQIFDWNATAVEYPDTACVHDLITAKAEQVPDSVAVVCRDDRLSYGELNERANAMAQALRQSGVDRGSVVALCMERSIEMIVGMLGVLKSGAAYVPLDPRYPADRLSFMLQDCQATLLLTQDGLDADLPAERPATVLIQECRTGNHRSEQTVPCPSGTPDDLAYILYTSGSTGRPKGVRVRHVNVVNLMTAMSLEPGIGPADVLLSTSNYSFDMSVGDIFPSLGAGARVVLASREEVADARLLGALIASSGATIMHSTPTMWQALIATGWIGDHRLVAVCGGEPLGESLASALLDRCGTVWNGYGPTETTVYATFSRVEPNTAITIGRPSGNRRVYVLDARQHPVPIGMSGEIFIAGQGVAAGYVNNQEETSKRFLPDPFVPGDRMYRTGDQGRLLADGRLQHLGRLDDQVKLRGIRIEPGEIEAALLAVPGVSAAAVVLREDEPGDQRLVAYVVADEVSLVATDVRQRLRLTLPEQLVPSAIVFLAAMPVTSSGKIDRSALPDPDEPLGAAATLEEPRSDTEKRLARIWASTLRVERIGRSDNFFDMGGHSLLAVRMVMAVERDLGVDLPLAALFEGGATIAGLAAVIESRQSRQLLTTPAGDSDSRPPVFIIHPSELSMIAMRHFFGPLGAERRVVGLLPERIDRHFRRSGTVQQVARPILAQIREAQPHGPYHLAGYSLAALLAYELAGQLRRDGEEVHWLCLMDSGAPAATRALMAPLRRVRRLRGMSFGSIYRKADAHVRRAVDAAIVRLHLRPSGEWTDALDYRAAWKLAARYDGVGHDAPMHLFVTLDTERVYGSDSLGWRDLHRGALTICRAPGEHLTMLRQPHVDLLAVEVATSFRRSVEQAGVMAPTA